MFQVRCLAADAKAGCMKFILKKYNSNRCFPNQETHYMIPGGFSMTAEFYRVLSISGMTEHLPLTPSILVGSTMTVRVLVCDEQS